MSHIQELRDVIHRLHGQGYARSKRPGERDASGRDGMGWSSRSISLAAAIRRPTGYTHGRTIRTIRRIQSTM